MAIRRVVGILMGLTVTTLLGGCGQTGVPLPPSLNLPTPVTDLSASRVGDRVRLQWTMPRRTTDKLPLKGNQAVHICRKLESGVCEAVADKGFAAEKPAAYEDVLPPEFATGPPHLLTYFVEVRNHQGHTDGASNAAYTAAGAAPPAIGGFSGMIQANGVLLQWQPARIAGEKQTTVLHRILLSAPTALKPAKKTAFGGQSATPPVQTLAVAAEEDADPGKALDRDALFDQKYSYSANRVGKLALAGHSIQIEGTPSETITVDTKDVFPPSVPESLAVVPVPDEGSIDLSWTPDMEPDLAGYIVYRRDAASAGPPERDLQKPITRKPIPEPAFRDTTAQRGREYAYSVSAVDRSGNESARSPEVTETLPNP